MSNTSTPFGEVHYDTPQEATTSLAGPNGQAVVEEIPLDDPRLLSSENVESNATGDAYASPPVLPDGKWRAKLTLAKIKDAKGTEQDFRTSMATWRTPQQPFFAVNVQSEVIDHSGKFDGYKLTEYWVKTLVGDRGPGEGTSQLATIVRASGGKVPMGGNQKAMLDAGLRHLASEPEVVIETAWEARCQTCEEACEKRGEKKSKAFHVRGMHRFPQPRTGQWSPEIECPTCHATLRAQPRIVQYFPLSVPHQGAATAKKTA